MYNLDGYCRFSSSLGFARAQFNAIKCDDDDDADVDDEGGGDGNGLNDGGTQYLDAPVGMHLVAPWIYTYALYDGTLFWLNERIYQIIYDSHAAIYENVSKA